jgi:hypothetical protein
MFYLDEMALLFSLENLLTEEGMDSIGKDFKVQQYTHKAQSEEEKKQELQGPSEHAKVTTNSKVVPERGMALI